MRGYLIATALMLAGGCVVWAAAVNAAIVFYMLGGLLLLGGLLGLCAAVASDVAVNAVVRLLEHAANVDVGEVDVDDLESGEQGCRQELVSSIGKAGVAVVRTRQGDAV